MALIVLTWDLPPANQVEAYVQKARTEWVPGILAQPGVREFRAYRNPLDTTPHVMGHVEFDTLESVHTYFESMAYAAIVSGLNTAGCANVSAQVWDTSPLVPEPLRPPGG